MTLTLATLPLLCLYNLNKQPFFDLHTGLLTSCFSLNTNSYKHLPMQQPTVKIPLDFLFIVKVLDPLTQKIQRWVGLDCFFWSKICFVIAIVTGWIRIGMIILSGLILPSSISNGVLTTLLFFIHYGLLNWNRHEMLCEKHGLPLGRKLGYEAVEQGCKNPFLLSPRRHLFLWAMIESIFTIIRLILGVPILLILGGALRSAPATFGYLGSALMACTPLPPKKSKLREGFEKLKELLTPREEGLPAPAGA